MLGVGMKTGQRSDLMSHVVANVRSEPVMHPVELAKLKSPKYVNVKSFRELNVTEFTL